MKLIINLLSLFFVLNCFSQKNMDTIYGNPKSVREKVEFLNKKKKNYKFMRHDGDYGHATIFTPKGIKNRFHLYWYNYHWVFYVNYKKEFLKNGKAKNEIWYNRDATFKRSYNYSYDKNENLIEEKEFWYDDEFWLQRNYYDINNKRIASTRNYSDETNEFKHWYHKRDINNNIIETKSYSEEGQKVIVKYELNKSGDVLKKYRQENFRWITNENGIKEKRDSLGQKYIIREYLYNENGNKELELSYGYETNKVSRKTIYKYDLRNNLIYEGYARDTVYSYRKYTYDLNNNKTRYEYSVVNNSSTRELVKYKYDKKGYIINVSCRFRNKDYEIDFKYKFDKKGNWTKITKIVNGEPLYIWTRKIKYY